MASIGSIASNASIGNSVSIAVARKALDAQELEGALAISLIRQAVSISEGTSRGSVSPVGDCSSCGGGLDVTA